MKSILRQQLPKSLAVGLLAAGLAAGTAQAAPAADPAPAAVADSGSSSGSLNSANIGILRTMLLCTLGLQTGQSCNLMP